MTAQAGIPLPLDQIAEYCRRNHIRSLSLFGSILRDDLCPDSDADLLVEFEPDAQVGFLALGRMQREFSQLLRRPVDLVPKGGLKPKIRDAVLSTAEVVYAS